MGSRNKEQSSRQPLLSSLVVRPSMSDGEGGGRNLGNDYDINGERREPQYSRHARYSDNPGYRMRAGSGSPERYRTSDHFYNPNFDRTESFTRGSEFGRNSDRLRDRSPIYTRGGLRGFGRGRRGGGGYIRGRGGGRFGRPYDRPEFGHPTPRGNNPNVIPREGDWLCSDPLCGNLNFARRDYCNSCMKPRFGRGGSPRRGYPGPLHTAARHVRDPPLDASPDRGFHGYRSSPPRGWARDAPRDLGAGGPPPNYSSRYSDYDLRRDPIACPDVGYRGRDKFDRDPSMDWNTRDHARDEYFNEKKSFDRTMPSPLSPSERGRWNRELRERSRSPVRATRPDIYLERRPTERLNASSERLRNVF